MIDTPLFACIQWFYLAAVFGPEAVHLMREAGERIATGRFTVVPSGLAATLDVQADLFVSNWARRVPIGNFLPHQNYIVR